MIYDLSHEFLIKIGYNLEHNKYTNNIIPQLDVYVSLSQNSIGTT